MAFWRQEPWRRILWRRPAEKGHELPLTYGLPEDAGCVLKFFDALSDDFLGDIREPDGVFVSAKFQITANGCKDGEARLVDLPSYISAGVRCDIYRDSEHCWYSGRVSDIAVPRREDEITLSLSGIAEDLKLKIINGIYGSRVAIDEAVSNGDITSEQGALVTVVTDISDIVKDIVSGIEARSAILYDISKVQTTGYAPGIVDFDHISLDSALEKLANLAGTFEYGVGADRYFFFREKSGDILLHLWEGIHCDSIDMDLDGSDLWNRVWVKVGEVDDEDGSSFLSDPVEDTESQGKYGIRETTVSASNLDATDAAEYGRWYLNDHKDPVVSGTIGKVPLGQWEEGPSCDGYVRVTLGSERVAVAGQESNDNVDLLPEYVLTLEKIQVFLAAGGSYASIEAGRKQQTLTDVLKAVIRRQEDSDRINDDRFKNL